MRARGEVRKKAKEKEGEKNVIVIDYPVYAHLIPLNHHY